MRTTLNGLKSRYSGSPSSVFDAVRTEYPSFRHLFGCVVDQPESDSGRLPDCRSPLSVSLRAFDYAFCHYHADASSNSSGNARPGCPSRNALESTAQRLDKIDPPDLMQGSSELN